LRRAIRSVSRTASSAALPLDEAGRRRPPDGCRFVHQVPHGGPEVPGEEGVEQGVDGGVGISGQKGERGDDVGQVLGVVGEPVQPEAAAVQRQVAHGERRHDGGQQADGPTPPGNDRRRRAGLLHVLGQGEAKGDRGGLVCLLIRALGYENTLRFMAGR